MEAIQERFGVSRKIAVAIVAVVAVAVGVVIESGDVANFVDGCGFNLHYSTGSIASQFVFLGMPSWVCKGAGTDGTREKDWKMV